MKLFIDSANLEEIKEVASYGILDGVTTNPSLIKKEVDRLKKSGKKITLEVQIKKILKTAKGKPVSLEVVGTDFKEMIKEGLILYKKFNSVARNVYVKISVNPCQENVCKKDADGIKAIKYLSSKRIPINTTLIFTPEQALLAAKAGAKIVSPFSGREDDYIRELNRIKFEKTDYYPAKGKSNFNDRGILSGIDLIKKCKVLFSAQKIKCEVLAASIRNKRQFREAALVGADIATVPFKVIQSLLKHSKTRDGMKKFTEDVTPEYAKILGYKK